MIMPMEQSPIQQSSYDTEYHIGHKLEWTTEHSDGITHLAYSPLQENPFFIVGSEDNSISLMRQDGTQEFQSGIEGIGQITALAISPDAQEIAVGTLGTRPSVILCDSHTGKCKNYIHLADGGQSHHRIRDIAYSPSGDCWAAVIHDGPIYLCTTKYPYPITKVLNVYNARSARFLSDNCLRIATQDGKIYTFPIQQPKLTEEFDMYEYVPVAHMISRPVLSQDGQEYIASFLPRKTIRPEEVAVYIFDLTHKTCVDIMEGHGISQASFSQNRSVCASIFKRMLTTYHRISEPGVEGFNHIVTHSSIPSTTATAVACSPDGSHMVTSLRPQTIAFWRLIKKCQQLRDHSCP
jgi:WD40 repeat protein